MNETHLDETHPEIVKRLTRANGHVKSNLEMIETGRLCFNLAHLLHAVEKAIGQAKGP